MAGTFLAIPWALARIGPWEPPGVWIPYLLATTGLWRSLTTRREQVLLTLGSHEGSPEQARHPNELSRGKAEGPGLRIVQISDPHLGPFMSVARLHGICQRAVEASPDLIALTGDLLTVSSNHDEVALTQALAPLRDHPRVYACMGNHDLEAQGLVRRALAANGIRLLIDEAELVHTPSGPVQVAGCQHRWRESREHLQAFLAPSRASRRKGARSPAWCSSTIPRASLNAPKAPPISSSRATPTVATWDW